MKPLSDPISMVESDSDDEEGSGYQEDQRKKIRDKCLTKEAHVARKRRPVEGMGIFHRHPCQKCRKTGEKCEVEKGGGACVRCVRSKCRCQYSVKGPKRTRVEQKKEERDKIGIVKLRNGEAEPRPRLIRKLKSNTKTNPSQTVKKGHSQSTPFVVDSDDEIVESLRIPIVDVSDDDARPLKSAVANIQPRIRDQKYDIKSNGHIAQLEKQVQDLIRNLHVVEELQPVMVRLKSLENNIDRIGDMISLLCRHLGLPVKGVHTVSKEELELMPEDEEDGGIPGE